MSDNLITRLRAVDLYKEDEEFVLVPLCREAADKINQLRTVLINARLQIEYLHEKFQETGRGNAALARIDDVLGD